WLGLANTAAREIDEEDESEEAQEVRKARGQLGDLVRDLGVPVPKLYSEMVERLIEDKFGIRRGDTFEFWSPVREKEVETQRRHIVLFRGIESIMVEGVFGDLGVRVQYMEGDWRVKDGVQRKGKTGMMTLRRVQGMDVLRTDRSRVAERVRERERKRIADRVVTTPVTAKVFYESLVEDANEYVSMSEENVDSLIEKIKGGYEEYGFTPTTNDREELITILVALEYNLVPGQTILVNGNAYIYFGIVIGADGRPGINLGEITEKIPETPSSIEIVPVTVTDFVTQGIKPNDLVTLRWMNGEINEDLIYLGVERGVVDGVDWVVVAEPGGVLNIRLSDIAEVVITKGRRGFPKEAKTRAERIIEQMTKEGGAPQEFLVNPNLFERAFQAMRDRESGNYNKAYEAWSYIRTNFSKADYAGRRINPAEIEYVKRQINAVRTAEADAAARAVRIAHKIPGAKGTQTYDMNKLEAGTRRSDVVDGTRLEEEYGLNLEKVVGEAVSLSRDLVPKALAMLEDARLSKSKEEIDSIIENMRQVGIVSEGVTAFGAAITELEAKAEDIGKKPEIENVEIRLTD
ncbi:MAG: hypothetical protein ACE5JK_08355, partial [Candidatus Omnitrophota bacterium]